ncbi:hypothetical protein [Corynebacterium bovis]|uniref:Trypsin n=1 Tax=Corynebacterium bovis DSM 20582 = CIP 54.80 TaxID=927655 RepID=A0A8H9YA44_9CORY|nr:hypothetical protein [Corynebacterium bovis]MBB3116815.1 hypothetical protein [Corynebacterium bovis DSM 20582 = CIP 54.80]MDK8511737.1 hypothetical protein [Corynebacterium bovis]QQC46758.1 hypothetical protein I6I09_06410 [Corynebacterium bovis]RRO79121.1 hypothetical protein CXF38_10175 [Corynebacterium bovis]RRO80170.1 hypothetical protein CXF36_08975 [Corynebacterium bovis]
MTRSRTIVRPVALALAGLTAAAVLAGPASAHPAPSSDDVAAGSSQLAGSLAHDHDHGHTHGSSSAAGDVTVSPMPEGLGVATVSYLDGLTRCHGVQIAPTWVLTDSTCTTGDSQEIRTAKTASFPEGWSSDIKETYHGNLEKGSVASGLVELDSPTRQPSAEISDETPKVGDTVQVMVYTDNGPEAWSIPVLSVDDNGGKGTVAFRGPKLEQGRGITEGMQTNRYTGAPVFKDGKLIGMFSEANAVDSYFVTLHGLKPWIDEVTDGAVK